ncbi:hypothetical protein N431DRAFT_475473 [Stipitochalara longipes BDJ]|nr:hypothetical protein N431DRAFT_475473 [Stipitochalara longipes BDJ]
MLAKRVKDKTKRLEATKRNNQPHGTITDSAGNLSEGEEDTKLIGAQLDMGEEDSGDEGNSEGELGEEDIEVTTETLDDKYQTDAEDDTPLVHLELQPVYDDLGDWRKEQDHPDGGKQYEWSGIGYPEDEYLCVEDFEDETFIDRAKPSVVELVNDLLDIKNRSTAEIADNGIEIEDIKYGRTIQKFKLNGRSVAKVKFVDADVSKGKYQKLKTSIEFEKLLSRKMGAQGKKPSLQAEQYVAAHLLLRVPGGDINIRQQDYWKKLRGLAQQQLYLNPNLEIRALEDLKATLDPALRNMLEMLFYLINSEIVMILDNADDIIGVKVSDAFRKLLKKSIELKVLNGFQTYSILQLVPHLDFTRHGLHWAEHPSGASHHGCGFASGHSQGKDKMYAKRDSGERLKGASEHVLKQYDNLRRSSFCACTEILSFIFEHLDPGLFAKYQTVAQVLEKHGDPKIIFKTRPDIDIFSVKALLRRKRLEYGFAGLVPLGGFKGGDLLLRELGLQIVAPAGCVQLIRGRELRHSITDYTGDRVVTVSVTHEAMKKWAQRTVEDPASSVEWQQHGEKRQHTSSDGESVEVETGGPGEAVLTANRRSKGAQGATNQKRARKCQRK